MCEQQALLVVPRSCLWLDGLDTWKRALRVLGETMVFAIEDRLECCLATSYFTIRQKQYVWRNADMYLGSVGTCVTPFVRARCPFAFEVVGEISGDLGGVVRRSLGGGGDVCATAGGLTAFLNLADCGGNGSLLGPDRAGTLTLDHCSAEAQHTWCFGWF